MPQIKKEKAIRFKPTKQTLEALEALRHSTNHKTMTAIIESAILNYSISCQPCQPSSSKQPK
jgi:hypothetical protein